MRGRDEIWRVCEQAVRNVNTPRCIAKGDWKRLRRRYLFWLLVFEVWELLWALRRYQVLRARQMRTPWHETTVRADLAHQVEEAQRNVKHEIGDCVAFLAFLADRCCL